MLNQFELHQQQCAMPHVSNVFLPTCSATALQDYVGSVMGLSQFVYATNNPLEAELVRRHMQMSEAERQNILAAYQEINKPWYKVGKAARKFIGHLLGWEPEVDPDILFVEKMLDNAAELDALIIKIDSLTLNAEIEDLPKMESAYLEGIDLRKVNAEGKLDVYLLNFKYAEGESMHMITERVKQKRVIQVAQQQQEEANIKGLIPVQSNTSSFSM